MIKYSVDKMSDPIRMLRVGDTFSFAQSEASSVFVVTRLDLRGDATRICMTYRNVKTDRLITDDLHYMKDIWRRHKVKTKLEPEPFVKCKPWEFNIGDCFGFYVRPNNVYEITDIYKTSTGYSGKYVQLSSGREYSMNWSAEKVLYRHPKDCLKDFPVTSDILDRLEEKEKPMNDIQLNNLITMAQADRGMFTRATVTFDGSLKEYNFKLPTSLRGVVKVGDQVVVEAADGRTDLNVVATLVAIHDDTDFDYSLNVKWKWIISKVSRNAFDVMKQAEADAMQKLKLKGSREALEKALGVNVKDIDLGA